MQIVQAEPAFGVLADEDAGNGEAIDATNAHRGRLVVIYERDGKRYVRKVAELLEKFKGK